MCSIVVVVHELIDTQKPEKFVDLAGHCPNCGVCVKVIFEAVDKTRESIWVMLVQSWKSEMLSCEAHSRDRAFLRAELGTRFNLV